MELPEVTFFDDFYFWFNTETKKEYYATPLYFYKASFDLDNINGVRDVYYKETEIVIELTAYDENGERKPYVDRLLEWQDIVFFDFYDEESGPHSVYYTAWKDLNEAYDEENKYQVTYLDEKEGVLVINVIKS